ncbi:hypothetical protein ABT083_29825 [Streptomyces goshikiensis]|uniref:hypothetical protein n=1 Tax=Streptomyces goshikiensis TaxID=1942 RepID=UPI00332E0D2B
MTEQWTSALSFSSFSVPLRPDGTPAATDPRRSIEDIAMRWQSHSSHGATAGWASDAALRKAAAPARYGALVNRVVEIHGVAGSIGEQLTLAWAAEQDAQRFQSPQIERPADHLETTLAAQRMAVRALCEMSTHFLLGAVHSLANLVLRVLLCDAQAAALINAERQNRSAKGFEPASSRKGAWPTFSPTAELWSRVLPTAARASGLRSHEVLVTRLLSLQQDPRFEALDARRGMDYHRHRPQSLDHRSPSSGIVSTDAATGTSIMRMPSARMDSRSDEQAVHRICTDALTCVSEVLDDMEPLIAEALSACHLAWRPGTVRS